MPYRLHTFDGVVLPDRVPEDDLSTGMSETSLLDSVGGVVDYYGSRAHLARRQSITLRGLYAGESSYFVDDLGNFLVDDLGNFLIDGSALQVLQAQVDAIKAKTGARGALVRLREQDSSEQWKTARLLGVSHRQTVADALTVALLDCTFETAMAAWRAPTATATSVSAAAATPTGLTPDVAGDVTVDDTVLTITRTSGTITQISVTCPDLGVDLTLVTSIGASESVIVDCGAQTIRRGSTDIYSGLTRNAGHTARGWLPLAPGSNPYVVTCTGGAATVAFSHYNQFQ